jgi:ELWxxDGT repeat protein
MKKHISSINFRTWAVLVLLLLHGRYANAQAVLSKDLNPGVRNTNPEYLVSFAGHLYFSGLDSSWTTGLYRSDPATDDYFRFPGIIAPAQLKVINDQLYFSALDSRSRKHLWTSDGTVSGTVDLGVVMDSGRSGYPDMMTPLNDKMLFRSYD